MLLREPRPGDAPQPRDLRHGGHLAAIEHPDGRLEASKESVTVTGWENCWPSGPK